MLFEEILIDEMAKPAKICDKCGHQMTGYHYWYKGGWHCKKSVRQDKEETATTKKQPKQKKELSRPADMWKQVFKGHKEALQHIEKADEAAKRRERKERKEEQKTSVSESFSDLDDRIWEGFRKMDLRAKACHFGKI